ncbi:MAG: hypothetical protein ABJ327_05445 [Litoreibacter sp.]
MPRLKGFRFPRESVRPLLLIEFQTNPYGRAQSSRCSRNRVYPRSRLEAEFGLWSAPYRKTRGDIVCSDLTAEDVWDPPALPSLLDHLNSPIDLFLADGAYAGELTSDLLAARFWAECMGAMKNAARCMAETKIHRRHKH